MPQKQTAALLEMAHNKNQDVDDKFDQFAMIIRHLFFEMLAVSDNEAEKPTTGHIFVALLWPTII